MYGSSAQGGLEARGGGAAPSESPDAARSEGVKGGRGGEWEVEVQAAFGN